MQTQTATFIENPELRTALAGIARRSPSPEDAVSTMVLALLERAKAQPEFTSQKLGYIIKLAKWRAMTIARSERRYAARVDQDYLAGLERETPEGEGQSYEDLLPSESLTPEEIVLRRERWQEINTGLATLTERQREVVNLLAQGYSTREAGDMLGISQGAVCMARQRARQALRGSE